MKTLVIAEKPSVGRDIARVLKCAQKGEGYLYGGDYVVSWAVGHLATLKEPDDYDPAYKKWRMEHLPIIPEVMRCKAVPKTKTQLTLLKKLMNDKETGGIVCATDSGREGELIFRYIYELAGCTKPFKRLWISSMTDAAITEGFAKLRDGCEYDALYTSAKCRAEADWLVGMNASRAFTLQYGTLLSVGRVQTPTLAVIAERQREIDAFVPEDYWEVKASLAAEGGNYTGLWFDSAQKNATETKISSREKADAIAAALLRQRAGAVHRIETEEKRQPPPQLFDLTELQRECNRKLGFSAQKTLTIAQALYEKYKLITYPRTDSRYLSHDLVPKLTAVARALENIEPYREAAAYVLGLPKLPVTSRIVDDAKVTDHHAIIPTGAKTLPSSLSKDERAVYDRIARKFLAAFHPAYVYLVTTVITQVGDEYFVSKGRTVTDDGWMILYKQETDEPDERDGITPLPKLSEGEAVRVTDAKVLQKKTQPPKAYTEATLLSAMENAGRLVTDEALKEKLKESGLGTPATRAATIERLLEVGYVERRKKNLVPTEKGMKLIEIVPKELRSAETTGKWERSLSRIAKGSMDEARFMESICNYVRYIVDNAASGDPENKQNLFPKESRATAARGGKAAKKRASICACPKCGGQIFENTKAYYCSRWKEGCAFTLWKSTLAKEGKQADDATVRAVCAELASPGANVTG